MPLQLLEMNPEMSLILLVSELRDDSSGFGVYQSEAWGILERHTHRPEAVRGPPTLHTSTVLTQLPTPAR